MSFSKRLSAVAARSYTTLTFLLIRLFISVIWLDLASSCPTDANCCFALPFLDLTQGFDRDPFPRMMPHEVQNFLEG